MSTAYAVLSDPNKKRQYDLHGDEEIGSLNVEELGTMGRLFGALISKAGIPLPTEITQKVLTAAQHLSKGTTSGTSYITKFVLVRKKMKKIDWH